MGTNQDGSKSVAQAEKERDEAKQEARVVQLVATVEGDAKARVEADMTKALNSLAAAEEFRCQSKAEIALLEAKFALVETE